MADLPPEIFTDILARLPVKSVLRFRSVSKACRSLLDSSNFMHLHLKSSTQTNSNQMVILRSGPDIFAVDLEKLDEAVELNHPLMCYGSRIYILGFCHGLVCLKNVADDVALWNPSLKKYRILTPPPDEKNRGSGSAIYGLDVFGFGSDILNEDYKVVRISLFIDLNDLSYDSEVKVFSLKTNFWRTAERMPCALRQPKKVGVLVGGALHWVVIKKLEPDDPEFVIAFDINTEKFRVVPLPDFKDEKILLSVTVLGGCLCLLAKYENVRVDVWLMKEYGVSESWCKGFTIAQSETMRSFFKSLCPLAFSKDGDEVLLEVDSKKLCWYHLIYKTVTRVIIPRMPNSFESSMCLGSLVPPTLERRFDSNEEMLEQNKKKRDDFLSEGFKLVL